MSWRDNALATDALATQGFYDEESNTLLQDSLATALRDLWVKDPVRASKDDILEKKITLSRKGLTKIEVLDNILPGFRERYELNDDEARQVKKSPNEVPELVERAKAVTDVGNLLWGTLGKTGRAGLAQSLILQRGLLLIEADAKRDGVATKVKAATDDHDLIIELYVRPRGDQLVKVSGGVRDDCTMVGMTFEGIGDRMKRELGSHVTTAVTRLLQVATPDLQAILAPAPAPETKALPAQKSSTR